MQVTQLFELPLGLDAAFGSFYDHLFSHSVVNKLFSLMNPAIIEVAVYFGYASVLAVPIFAAYANFLIQVPDHLPDAGGGPNWAQASLKNRPLGHRTAFTRQISVSALR